MWGPIGYAFSMAAGYIGGRATEKLIEPSTIDVIEEGDRKVRIVKYWDLWPPSTKPRQFKAEELRAGLWMATGIQGPKREDVEERARAMLSQGPG